MYNFPYIIIIIIFGTTCTKDYYKPILYNVQFPFSQNVKILIPTNNLECCTVQHSIIY